MRAEWPEVLPAIPVLPQPCFETDGAAHIHVVPDEREIVVDLHTRSVEPGHDGSHVMYARLDHVVVRRPWFGVGWERAVRLAIEGVRRRHQAKAQAAYDAEAIAARVLDQPEGGSW